MANFKDIYFVNTSGTEKTFDNKNSNLYINVGTEKSTKGLPSSIYANLPILSGGYKYYKLEQLVMDLHDRGQSWWQLLDNIDSCRYLRHNHLSSDYRDCSVDFSSIGSAPVQKDLKSVYLNGDFASFLNGNMRVGTIYGSEGGSNFSTHNEDEEEIIFVDKNVQTFKVKRNGAALSQYILRELLSDYVIEQANRICAYRNTDYLSNKDFYQLNIAVPSIDRQDEVLLEDGDTFTGKRMTYNEGMKLIYEAMANIRNNHIIEDNNSILFIITAYIQGWFEDDEATDGCVVQPIYNLSKRLQKDDFISKIGLKEQLSQIVTAYEGKEMELSSLYGTLIFNFQREWWDKYWATAFDEILSKNVSVPGQSLGDFWQPSELTRLIQYLCGYGRQFPTIYNPFAGTGTFCSLAKETSTYLGQEALESLHSLGVIRVMSLGINPEQMIHEDSSRNWGQGKKRFDLIVGFAPMGLKKNVTKAMGIEWNAKSISLSDFLIYKGSASLNPGGKFIAIVPLSFLHNDGLTGALRRKLVDEGRVDTIIQLPAGLLYGTGIPVCIVILNDESRKSDSVRLIDATQFSKKEGRVNILQVEDLMEVIYAKDKLYVKTVSPNIIKKGNYKLLPSQYLKDESNTLTNIPDGFKVVALKEIVSFVKGSKCDSDKARLIRGKDLSNDDEIDYLTFDNLTPEVIDAKNSNRVTDDAILLQRVRYLKPTLFRYQEGLDVVLSQNVIAITTTKDVDPYYLVSELREEYVSEQVNKMTMGATIPMLSKNDILNIKVLLPPRDLQHTFFVNAQRLERENKQKELKVDEFIQRERERINEMMRIRRHRINPVISGLKSNVKLLQEELYTLDIANLELSEGYTLKDALDNMSDNLVQLKQLSDNITIETNIGMSESINIIDFLKGYNYIHTMPDRHFTVELIAPENEDLFQNIVFNSSNLTEVLEEIIHNAEKHFKPGEKYGKVLLVPRIEGSVISLLICNNGVPVPDDFDEGRSFDAGYKKDINGTGQGLFRVRQICDNFDARVRWENDKENAMPVGLRITFKLSKD